MSYERISDCYWTRDMAKENVRKFRYVAINLVQKQREPKNVPHLASARTRYLVWIGFRATPLVAISKCAKYRQYAHLSHNASDTHTHDRCVCVCVGNNRKIWTPQFVINFLDALPVRRPKRPRAQIQFTWTTDSSTNNNWIISNNFTANRPYPVWVMIVFIRAKLTTTLKCIIIKKVSR